MKGPAGTTVVRLSFWMLVFSTLAMALVQPVTAGTEAAPEIADPAGDHAVGGAAPASQVGYAKADVQSAWIDGETASHIKVNILLGGAPAGNNQFDNEWIFHASFGGTEVTAGIATTGGSAPSAPVVTGAAESFEVVDTVLVLTIPKSAYGTPVAGDPLTGLFVESNHNLFTVGAPFVTDRAPNEGFGLDYIFTGGAPGPAPNPGDTDNDGLNDTCETQYFGNLTATDNATADPDGDGLTNGQECALGTDPTKADTDGDGVNDKDDPFPTDPSKGGTNTTSSSTSTSRSSSSSSSRSSSSGSATSEDKCADGDTSDAVDCLQSDVGYLGMSAGGFLAVVVLCAIALATRWSL